MFPINHQQNIVIDARDIVNTAQLLTGNDQHSKHTFLLLACKLAATYSCNYYYMEVKTPTHHLAFLTTSDEIPETLGKEGKGGEVENRMPVVSIEQKYI